LPESCMGRARISVDWTARCCWLSMVRAGSKGPQSFQGPLCAIRPALRSRHRRARHLGTLERVRYRVMRTVAASGAHLKKYLSAISSATHKIDGDQHAWQASFDVIGITSVPAYCWWGGGGGLLAQPSVPLGSGHYTCGLLLHSIVCGRKHVLACSCQHAKHMCRFRVSVWGGQEQNFEWQASFIRGYDTREPVPLPVHQDCPPRWVRRNAANAERCLVYILVCRRYRSGVQTVHICVEIWRVRKDAISTVAAPVICIYI
jgi:hypothetical protein